MNNLLINAREERLFSLATTFGTKTELFSKLYVDYKYPLKSENNILISFSSYIPNVLIPENKINTNFVETEEQINQEKILFLDTKVTPLLISLIKCEDFEFGQSSESINLVNKHIEENKSATKEWFNRLFVKYFASKNETNILIGLLRVVEFLNESFNPISQTIALASLSHYNNEVKELGVRILESSYSIENLNILKNIQTEIKWLQDYINQVIKDFEQILSCQS